MSGSLISLSPDLRRLRDAGFEISIVKSRLVVTHVPYVTPAKKVAYGMLVSDLTLAGDVTTVPDNHVVYFVGETPSDASGKPLSKLLLDGQPGVQVSDTITATHWFSSKPVPPARYEDYYEKMTTYIAALDGHAAQVDPSATARTHRVVPDDTESPFMYLDTATSRAGTFAASRKLELPAVALIGVGGTGAHILDLVAKAPVEEIHLFDPDRFLQHNAFRSPGAASLEELQASPMKVDYFASTYLAMRRGVVPHPVAVDDDNVELLRQMDFVFVAIDHGPSKPAIMAFLERQGIPFVDAGMGISAEDDQVSGVLRVTRSTDRGHSRQNARRRISVGSGEAGEYDSNVQIADLNALNAALAVIQFKKQFGFYADTMDDHFTAYVIDSNSLINEDGPDE